jgi:hypothetical protein
MVPIACGHLMLPCLGPVWVVSFSGEPRCGSRVSVYAPDGSPRRFERLLALACAKEFKPGADYSGGYPVFVYTTEDSTANRLYVATFRFIGRQYREENCQVTDASEPRKLVEGKCDGRGMTGSP